MVETIQMNLFNYFMEDSSFTTGEAKQLIKEIKGMNVNDESIRARIYEGVEKGLFEKISRGVYKVSSQIHGKETSCLLVNGNGRDLSMIEDNSIDGIITDHPYNLQKALTGGNRKFATYELFRYEERDFQEKMRVLKDGAFLVEFLPEEREINYEYLFEVKQLARKVGFTYFSKVPWKKGEFKANTGRKATNTEDVLIFSKGKPRSLRLNQKKNLQVARDNSLDVRNKSSQEVADILMDNGLEVYYMSGTNGMLPTNFDFQPRSRAEKVMEAEKPVELLVEIINYISKPYEVLLDQFGGSGNFGIACLETDRYGIIIEKDLEMYERMRSNIENSIHQQIEDIYDEYEEDYEME
ncbi:MAG: site-specific DNA-methyltransferase [Coprobacillus sp.]|nr:site-specific DNA-methyltransferase [Coprobacillus sp.]